MFDENLVDQLIAGDREALDEINRHLETLNAEQRVRWAVEFLPATQIVSSSFGIQSALMLHLMTSVKADIHVVLIDTGYLFKETYQFIDELSERLKLNLHVYRSQQSSAWQEVRFGRLWEQGLEGLEKFNRITKVEPMKQALNQLGVGTWFAGLRRQQAGSRSDLSVLRVQDGYLKMHPVIDWSNRDVEFGRSDFPKPVSNPVHIERAG